MHREAEHVSVDTMELLPQVREYVLARDIPTPGWHADEAEIGRFRAAVTQALIELDLDRRLDGRLRQVSRTLTKMMTGVGVLEPLLAEEGVEEIIVRDGFVQLERRGRIEDVGHLADDAHFAKVAQRAADLGQRTLKGNRPFVLVDLPGGSRFTAIIPPLSRRGTAINVRAFARKTLSLTDLDRFGAFTPTAEVEQRSVTDLVERCPERHPERCGEPFDKLRTAPVEPPVEGRRPGPAACTERCPELAEELRRSEGPVEGEIREGELEILPPVAQLLAQVAMGNLATVLISGELGAGKTTLLNAMSVCVPVRVQLAVVETFEELRIHHPHALRVVVPGDRPDFPDMAEVLNVVITRMRPDLLIIGEIVRGEAPRFLDAINLGKKAWATIHGNDCLGALYRLETKALSSGLPHQAIREQVAAGVDLVVHLRQDPWTGHRYVAQVVEVKGLDEGGRYRLSGLYDAGDRGRMSVERLWGALTG